MTKLWKLKYFEKNNNESHLNIFRSLEIESFFKQSLKKKGIFNFKLNFSNTRITIFLSFYETRKQKKKERPIKKILKNAMKSLKNFTKNQYRIILRVDTIESEKTETSLLNIDFYRFKIHELQKLYFTLVGRRNSTKLLGVFIAKHLRATKRHNFFLSSLKTSLTLIIQQKLTRIKGIKILIKGRLNNAPRSNTRIIKIGKIPILTQNVQIEYSETTAFTPNGTIGIKIWLNHQNVAKRHQPLNLLLN